MDFDFCFPSHSPITCSSFPSMPAYIIWQKLPRFHGSASYDTNENVLILIYSNKFAHRAVERLFLPSEFCRPLPLSMNLITWHIWLGAGKLYLVDKLPILDTEVMGLARRDTDPAGPPMTYWQWAVPIQTYQRLQPSRFRSGLLVLCP